MSVGPAGHGACARPRRSCPACQTARDDRAGGRDGAVVHATTPGHPARHRTGAKSLLAGKAKTERACEGIFPPGSRGCEGPPGSQAPACHHVHGGRLAAHSAAQRGLSCPCSPFSLKSSLRRKWRYPVTYDTLGKNLTCTCPESPSAQEEGGRCRESGPAGCGIPGSPVRS